MLRQTGVNSVDPLKMLKNTVFLHQHVVKRVLFKFPDKYSKVSLESAYQTILRKKRKYPSNIFHARVNKDENSDSSVQCIF